MIPAPTDALVFIDVETTGRSPSRHQLVEVAAVRLAPGGEVTGWCSERIWPVDLEGHDPDAFKVNGFEPAAWARDGVPLEQALAALSRVIEPGDVVVGHNVRFDLGFLPSLRVHPACCTMDRASLLRSTHTIRSRSLETLAAYFGVTGIEAPAHSALGDTLRTIAVYHGLARRPPVAPALPAELRRRP